MVVLVDAVYSISISIAPLPGIIPLEGLILTSIVSCKKVNSKSKLIGILFLICYRFFNVIVKIVMFN